MKRQNERALAPRTTLSKSPVKIRAEGAQRASEVEKEQLVEVRAGLDDRRANRHLAAHTSGSWGRGTGNEPSPLQVVQGT